MEDKWNNSKISKWNKFCVCIGRCFFFFNVGFSYIGEIHTPLSIRIHQESSGLWELVWGVWFLIISMSLSHWISFSSMIKTRDKCCLFTDCLFYGSMHLGKRLWNFPTSNDNLLWFCQCIMFFIIKNRTSLSKICELFANNHKLQI